MSKIDKQTYDDLMDAKNKLCNYCEADECERCIVTQLADDAHAEAIEAGIIEDC